MDVTLDFPLPDPEALKRNLPPEVRVIYGPAGETARGFVLSAAGPRVSVELLR